jgi:hypothetical protein
MIATLRESTFRLRKVLETERRIAGGSNPNLAERARAEIPRLEEQIGEAEARLRALEALSPV